MTPESAQMQKGVLTRKHKYCVYIVASRSGSLYIGMTNNLYVRVMQHKEGKIEGFTAAYKVDRLVYWESFDEVVKAINREKQLKGWRRSKKIALIEWMNPYWKDQRRTGARRWHSLDSLDRCPVGTPCEAFAGVGRHGVLRLRACCASLAIAPLRMTELDSERGEIANLRAES